MSGFQLFAYVGVIAVGAIACSKIEKQSTFSGLPTQNSEKQNHDSSPPRINPVEPMPPTSCRSVEPVTKETDKNFGPYHDHDLTIRMFTSASGFGLERFIYFVNERKVIDRVELVSFPNDQLPFAYVLDTAPTLKLVRQAKHRSLDEFERLSLDALRRGEDLVWTREAPTRMFGAIRAQTRCLECHPSTKEGDLLGAFTYYLNMPIDRLYEKSLRK